MTEAQAQELLDLQRRTVAALEHLVRLQPRAPRERKLHPKRHVARVLGIRREKLALYIAAGVVCTTRSGKFDRISDEELQRHLAAGLPELAEPFRAPSGPRRRARVVSPRPPARSACPSENPGDEIRALKF